MVGISNSALFVLLHITTKVGNRMLFDYALFIITFIISAALAVIGIMISYQLYNTHQKPVLQILLYQQIFLISFFIYGIWGNIALHEILADLSLSKELSNKLTVYIPVLGIPFLIVSWFMLLRFSFRLNGIKESKLFPVIYFPLLFIFVLGFSVLVDKEIINVLSEPDLFIIRSIVAINFIIHIIFTIPFFNDKKNKPLTKEIRFLKKHALLYFVGVLLYSAVLSFYNYFGAISICISILFLFAVSISIPIVIKLNEKTQILPQHPSNINFSDFCNLYEISKREAEIIMEICTGKSNKDISEKLFISLQTVKDHNYRIYSKLGVKTRGQLTNLVREKTGI
ncbi:MAG TPA: helix-turn-helix transcriptional regulator [Draconibacterium sp.]|nr:helix-turn-helix transcriptional regulator [Draconibacterium sp.]